MDYILKIFYEILAEIIGYIPSGSIPVSATNALTQMSGYIQYANNYFAIDTLWQILLLVILLHATILGIKLALWVYSLIRGGG